MNMFRRNCKIEEVGIDIEDSIEIKTEMESKIEIVDGEQN
jgi:hypothetical protein